MQVQTTELPTSPAADASGNRALDAAAAFAAVALVALGASGIWFRVPMPATLGPIAGIIAALASRRMVDAAITAAAGVLAGMSAATVLGRLGWASPAAWLPAVLISAGAAAAVAVVCALAIRSGGRVTRLLVFAAMALLIGSGWFASVNAVSVPDANGVSAVKRLVTIPAIEPGYNDEQLYMNYIARTASGMPYYQAVGTTLVEANKALPGTDHDIDLSAPAAFRLPLMYVALAKLPQNGISFVLATLAIGTLASVSAYWLARAFVATPFALIGAAVITSMYSGLSEGPQMFHSEVWAGAFALLSVTLFVYSQRKGAAPALAWGAAAAGLLAALTREIAVAYMLLGLIATLTVPSGRALRRWLPWVAALGLFAVAYALHARAVAAVYPTLGAGVSTGYAQWLDMSMLGGLSVVNRIAEVTWLSGWPVIAYVVLALIGSIAARGSTPVRTELIGAVIGGTLVVTFMHPSGTLMKGLPPGYWGHLAMPTVLACTGLVFALLPAWRSDAEDEPDAPRTDEVPAAV